MEYITIGLLVLGAVAVAIKSAYTRGKVCGVNDALRDPEGL
jgi:hypothetical protein